MSFIKKTLLFPVKVAGTAVLTATTAASAILRQASDVAGLEIGSELFGAGQDASINGLKAIWKSKDGTVTNCGSESEKLAQIASEKRAAAFRCLDMAQAARKAGNYEKEAQYQERHDMLVAESDALLKESRELAAKENQS